jgi:predicted NBD/HSP70 family sugar kinase
VVTDIPQPGETRRPTLEGIRRLNLGRVLRLVHASGGTSRAELTRETGLNRSTVAALVAELEAASLVEEQAPGSTGQVGRPSPLVAPGDQVVAIAVTPELDAVTAEVVSLGGRRLARVRRGVASVPSPEQTVELTVSILAELADALRGRLVTGIGLAVPGLVREREGLVVLAPHLGWREVPLAAMLGDATGLPVSLSNDATLGALAESRFGTGRDETDIVYLHGGPSGIGGGLVFGRAPLGGVDGFAGEIGHTLVAGAGRRCYCGASGHLDAEVRREELLAALGLTDAEGDRIDQQLREEYQRAPSPEVEAIVGRDVELLAVAIANAANLLNPRLVVLGGFLSALVGVAGERLTARVAELALPGVAASLTIAPAALGPSHIAIGAAELAFEPLLDDPLAFRFSATTRPPEGG